MISQIFFQIKFFLTASWQFFLTSWLASFFSINLVKVSETNSVCTNPFVDFKFFSYLTHWFLIHSLNLLLKRKFPASWKFGCKFPVVILWSWVMHASIIATKLEILWTLARIAILNTGFLCWGIVEETLFSSSEASNYLQLPYYDKTILLNSCNFNF